MTKIKKATVFLLLFLAVVLGLSLNVKSTRAETVKDEEIAPQGLYTDLSFTLNGSNGQVWFSVKNKFTLFPSTVTVYVDLYYSDTYQENYADMTLVASNYIKDLDQGKTITAKASTDSKQGYWKGRAYYKIDSDPWKEKLSATVLFNADGTAV